ncbi:MAG TPA: thymidine kinase [Myxococcales bacterium]|nr:thymidine kinase [Deltaproteobacteria bacterium]HAA57489.1 thymidine kinase [Myxococcales bacterium]
MYSNGHRSGWIEIITGPMFSGKSEELIRRLKRAVIARQRVAVFKPSTDDRYDAVDIVSHSKQRFTAYPIEQAAEILEKVEVGTNVVGIDEAQFFGDELLDICEDMANRGLRVVIAGLDMDYLGTPFPPMPQLMAVAESITKLQAVCMRCGAPATRSQRLVLDEGQVLVGATESYEARCRFCFEEPTPRQQNGQTIASVVPPHADMNSEQKAT